LYYEVNLIILSSSSLQTFNSVRNNTAQHSTAQHSPSHFGVTPCACLARLFFPVVFFAWHCCCIVLLLLLLLLLLLCFALLCFALLCFALLCFEPADRALIMRCSFKFWLHLIIVGCCLEVACLVTTDAVGSALPCLALPCLALPCFVLFCFRQLPACLPAATIDRSTICSLLLFLLCISLFFEPVY
jgi:hypothetical protein